MSKPQAVSIQELTSKAVLFSDKSQEAIRHGDVKTHLRWAGKMIDMAEALFERGAEGRDALARMLDHSDAGVRMLAGGWVMKFDPERALPVLEALTKLDRYGPDGELRPELNHLVIVAQGATWRWRVANGLASRDELPSGLDIDEFNRWRDSLPPLPEEDS